MFNSHISKSAIRNANKVLKSGFLNTGKYVLKLEQSLEDFWAYCNPIALNSGTAALHLALRSAGVGPGDEVITSPQTFIATAMSILYVGATPVFGDVDDNGNLNVDEFDQKGIHKLITDKTKAIIPVHWGGIPCWTAEHWLYHKQRYPSIMVI